MSNHINHMLSELAEFNRNGQLLTAKLLISLDSGELTKDRGAYYTNLELMFSHLIEAEYYIIGTIAKAVPELNLPTKEFKNLSFDEAVKHNILVSDLIIKLAEVITKEQLERETDFHGIKRDVQWLVLRIFSHSTHHRGQISQVLDTLKIEHDLMRMTSSL